MFLNPAASCVPWNKKNKCTQLFKNAPNPVHFVLYFLTRRMNTYHRYQKFVPLSWCDAIMQKLSEMGCLSTISKWMLFPEVLYVLISNCFHLLKMKYEMMTHHLTNVLPSKYANRSHLSRARDGGSIGVIFAAARGTLARLRSRIKAVTCKSHIYSSFLCLVISLIWVRFGGFCGLNS